MSRRKIESSSIAANDDSRVTEMSANATPQPSERKSVFERLGRPPIGRNVESRRALTRNDFEETDLRFKVSRKRREIVSPTVSAPLSTSLANTTSSTTVLTTRSQSPRTVSSLSQSLTQSTLKSVSHKSEENKDNKVKSLVLAPIRRSPSPSTHSTHASHNSHHQSVSSTGFTAIKRSANLANLSNEQKCQMHHKWDDDDDDELERKRLQLQRELQELDITGSETQTSKNDFSVQSKPLIDDIRSRTSSTISSENGSFSSTVKSNSKTKKSVVSDKKEIPKSKITNANKDNHNSVRDNKISEPRQQVSSSVSRSVKKLEESRARKKTGIKLDRHGNVRISLAEQERQKRLRAERFSQKRLSPVKRTAPERKAGVRSRRSYSPSAKRARDNNYNDKVGDDRRDTHYSHKTRRSNESNKDDHRIKTETKSRPHEVLIRSKSSDRVDDNKPKLEDIKSKVLGKDVRNSLSVNSPNSDEKREHSRDSRYSDRDNLSMTSSHDFRKGTHSSEQSPAHSSHSKISRISRVSRGSSVISDHSHRSKCELTPRSQEHAIHSQGIGNKISESNVSEGPIIDEMSPISADSSIPEVGDADIDITSPPLESETADHREEKSTLSSEVAKNEDESDDNFSDWSDDCDELLLQTDGFETLDEAGNLSETTQEKDLYNDYKLNAINRRNSKVSSFSPQSKEADDALEAISDDELDAIIGESEPVDTALDSKNLSSSRQMLDSLEIDWKSLISEPKTKPEFIPGSARKRFTPANVLMRIGFSQAFAGPLMTKKIIEFCQTELKDDFVPFRHPIAAIHALINERIRERRFLFQVDSSHSTALSGRKDLQIRKMLNKSGFKILENNVTTNAVNSIDSLTEVIA